MQFGLIPLRRLLARTRYGHLSLTLPDGRCVEVRGDQPGPQAAARLHRWRPLLRLALEGDLGLALSFCDGDWDSPDLLAVLEFGLANEAAWGRLPGGQALARWWGRLVHLAHANTRRGSRRNISHHYDLGNGFYRHWLDDSMLYSSALYSDAEDDTLEAAQARRVERILELLGSPDQAQVLEIGCGWGTLAAAIARRHDARVTALTLSTEQLDFAQERATAWGVGDRVDVRLQDYRDVEGQFDRIVSIEMIEAVGEAHWPQYFGVLRDRLKPGGVVLLQAITMGEEHFAGYRSEADFIQRCIFPGGMLPSTRVLHEQAARAGFVVEEVHRFGASYARTLAAWRQRFLAAWPDIEALGFNPAFRRMWTWYLCYCQAGFGAGRVDVGLYRMTVASQPPG